MSKFKDYLGDGAYADFDGFGIILTTENGIYATNTVYLEPEVMAALIRYAERIKQLRQDVQSAKAARSTDATGGV